MRVISRSVPHARRLAEVGVELSKAARLRLQWMDHNAAHGHNAAFTCRHFGIRCQTFYRWKRRLDPHRLESLDERSHPAPAGRVTPPGPGSWPWRCCTYAGRIPAGERTSWSSCCASKAGRSPPPWSAVSWAT